MTNKELHLVDLIERVLANPNAAISTTWVAEARMAIGSGREHQPARLRGSTLIVLSELKSGNAYTLKELCERIGTSELTSKAITAQLKILKSRGYATSTKDNQIVVTDYGMDY